jgi:hypothetical protein
MEWWSDGVLGDWKNGITECWSIGVMEEMILDFRSFGSAQDRFWIGKAKT